MKTEGPPLFSSLGHFLTFSQRLDLVQAGQLVEQVVGGALVADLGRAADVVVAEGAGGGGPVVHHVLAAEKVRQGERDGADAHHEHA